MDVEKTIEFILEHQAQITAMQAKAEEHVARHDGEIAQLNAVTSHINSILRRAVRLAVQEARNERKRRQELDARFEIQMDQIASAHLLNEEMVKKLGEKVDNLGEKVDKLVDGWQHPGGNGDKH